MQQLIIFALDCVASFNTGECYVVAAERYADVGDCQWCESAIPFRICQLYAEKISTTDEEETVALQYASS